MNQSVRKYVKTLRRAFLLRIHPDRFRQHSNSIRKEQASLVQAIEEWISSPAVLAYYNRSSRHGTTALDRYHRHSSSTKEYPYHLERSDGTLSRHILTLNAPVDNVLQGMASSLSGLGVNLPPFPLLQSNNTGEDRGHAGSDEDTRSNVLHGKRPYNHTTSDPFSNFSSNNTTDEMYEHMYRFVWSSHNPSADVDEQFDVVSRKGKHLKSFLQHLQPKDILLRKQQRLAAVASALVTRRAFQFQAVDGTGIGWSSASLTQCFHSLTQLFDEHKHRFHVTSFFPLRLELSKDERRSKQLCRYGGKLYLNPLDTPIQWLNTFLLVTPQTLTDVRTIQEKLVQYGKSVQNMFGGGLVKIKRGHSCSSEEYHACLQRLAAVAEGNHSSNLLQLILPLEETSFEPSLQPQYIQVIVESTASPRLRGIVTREGHIRVSSHMEPNEIIATILKLAENAQRAMAVELQHRRECDELVKQLIYNWNLETIRVYSPIVPTSQVLDCLRRLYKEAADSSSATMHNNTTNGKMHERLNFDWRQHLEGQSIGISSSGQFCHIGDDGCIVIPWDYR